MRLLVLVALLAPVAWAQQAGDGSPCSNECIAQNCDQASIRYGRYCGIGHTGCPGTEPCDDVDKCCRAHDRCVEKAGLLDANGCHEVFIRCLNKAEKSGKEGFSETCPWSLVIPTMRNGIQLAMQLTSMFGGGGGGGPALGTTGQRRKQRKEKPEL